jgi:hypothetical protein
LVATENDATLAPALVVRISASPPTFPTSMMRFTRTSWK